MSPHVPAIGKHVKRRTSAGSGSGRCGAGHLHLHRAAKELQRRIHQEPRCQPVAFAPILASFRLTTEREQNEAEGESKAAGNKAHARNGTEVAVPLKYRFFGAVKQQSALVLVPDVSVPAYAGAGGVQRAVAVSWES